MGIAAKPTLALAFAAIAAFEIAAAAYETFGGGALEGGAVSQALNSATSANDGVGGGGLKTGLAVVLAFGPTTGGGATLLTAVAQCRGTSGGGFFPGFGSGGDDLPIDPPLLPALAEVAEDGGIADASWPLCATLVELSLDALPYVSDERRAPTGAITSIVGEGDPDDEDDDDPDVPNATCTWSSTRLSQRDKRLAAILLTRTAWYTASS